LCLAAAAPLEVPPVTASTPPGQPASGNILEDAVVPPGTTASITAIKVPGSDTPVAPGSAPVALVDPTTGAVAGTLAVKPDGTLTFTPAPGYTGPVPPVTVTVTSTDGQSRDVPLSLTVNALLRDGSESPTLAAGSGALSLNVLDNALPPAGTTVNVTGFSLPGSTVVYPAGPSPVTVVDPVTGRTAGPVVVQPNGAVTFTPAAGLTGQAPAITYTVLSSDGQTSPGAVSVTVLPGEPHGCVRCGAVEVSPGLVCGCTACPAAVMHRPACHAC
jgi:CshA-type fibril repeat protein